MTAIKNLKLNSRSFICQKYFYLRCILDKTHFPLGIILLLKKDKYGNIKYVKYKYYLRKVNFRNNIVRSSRILLKIFLLTESFLLKNKNSIQTFFVLGDDLRQVSTRLITCRTQNRDAGICYSYILPFICVCISTRRYR